MLIKRTYRLYLLIATLVLCVAPAASAQQPVPASLITSKAPAKVIPELKHLSGMAGQWSVEMRRKGEQQVYRVTSQADWVLGGRFLRSQYHGDGISGMMLTTYDPELKAFRRWQFDHSGKSIEFTGHWDEPAKTMHFEHVSKDGNLRIVIENQRSDDGFHESFRIVVKDKDGQELNEFEGTSRRAATRSARAK